MSDDHAPSDSDASPDPLPAALEGAQYMLAGYYGSVSLGDELYATPVGHDPDDPDADQITNSSMAWMLWTEERVLATIRIGRFESAIHLANAAITHADNQRDRLETIDEVGFRQFLEQHPEDEDDDLGLGRGDYHA